MIYFFGDTHGHFRHVLEIVSRDRPTSIVFLGDLQVQRPLEVELESILGMTEIWFIHGNHDTVRISAIVDARFSVIVDDVSS